MKIAIAGLGLIGGSFAKAIASKTRHHIIGYDISRDVARRAYESGLIDDSGLDKFSEADIVLAALYPGTAAEFLKSNRSKFKRGAIVIDLCGVKRFVVGEVRELFSDVTYIGGHPMAGRELSGFGASVADLYEGASMILTPDDSTDPEALKTASNFFLSLGFAKIMITTPEHHDEMIAFTSQMAHIVSSAYVQNPVVDNFDGFSAGSFADMTRVAKLDENMWTELFMLNRDHLTEQLDIFIGNLTRFRKYISEGDSEPLREMLRDGREIKERLTKK
ncbi:prephenate dehydrogenase [Synergistales bacterium]|nr:prephenate dehydrogenase [Synergistales bacterium]GHV54775.1 prephenate dehydrogenase [Synergistales bacterium]